MPKLASKVLHRLTATRAAVSRALARSEHSVHPGAQTSGRRPNPHAPAGASDYLAVIQLPRLWRHLVAPRLVVTILNHKRYGRAEGVTFAYSERIATVSFSIFIRPPRP